MSNPQAPTLEGLHVYHAGCLANDRLWPHTPRCIDLDGYPPPCDSNWMLTTAAFAGGWLYAQNIAPGAALGPRPATDPTLWPVWEYGAAILEHLHFHDYYPRMQVLGAIAHQDTKIGLHRDHNAPPPEGTILNALTTFTRGITEGGEFVLPEDGVAFGLRHLRLVVFDGQHLHGVMPYETGPDAWRISLNFYLGAA